MALPSWNVTRLNGKLGIQCPRKDCKGKAVVSRKWLQPLRAERGNGETVLIKGRSCTYCFRAAAIPEEMIKR